MKWPSYIKSFNPFPRGMEDRIQFTGCYCFRYFNDLEMSQVTKQNNYFIL
jgi:hypothetical protein